MARRNSLLVSRTLYHIGVVTLMAAVIWVGVGIYGALNKHTNVDVDPKILEPINPVIDLEVIKALSDRLTIEPVQQQIATESASQPENVSIVVEQATPSAQGITP